MILLRAIYVALSYIVLMPWVVIKLTAFVVFVFSLWLLACFYVLLTFDVKGAKGLYKQYIEKELNQIVDGW